jgi:hypothetical protein
VRKVGMPPGADRVAALLAAIAAAEAWPTAPHRQPG